MQVTVSGDLNIQKRDVGAGVFSVGILCDACRFCAVLFLTNFFVELLYRSGDTTSLTGSLTIRNAESRVASGGLAYITVKQALPDNGEARITMKTALMVDGKKEALSARQQGEDVVITVPEAQKQVELRTDAPAELEVPVSYRGNLQVALQVED
ncbi:DUF5462 family protein [Yersinia enterocolitica]|nr:DUF5462 family protein [Yersinia enterocolitica]MBW5861874.1 DUF5462 family protein [Yersinia enterocolitica]MBW5866164.1 DUF5462 family protein [Yersinia enterocolitica]MBW5874853.1 DUF5462 family protein [Yersinia enterocolitica]